MKKIIEAEEKDNRTKGREGRQRLGERTFSAREENSTERGHSYRRFHTHVGKTVALSGVSMNNLESFAR